MKRALLRSMLGFIMLVVFQINAHAGAFTVFGPKVFVRGTGKPITETATFSIKNPNTIYTLKVYNGGNSSEYSKVTSAIVRLNGSTIFDTNNFNQQVTVLQKEVRLSKSNQLQVELRSATGSGLTINIEGEDDTPPAISVTSPLNGSYTNDPTITVSGTASDSISWINKVTVNGTTAEVIGGNYTSSIQLTEGQNLVTAAATDAAGNTGNASLSVILDTTPPKITLDPIPSLTNKPQLTITWKVSDASPITALTMNGIPATLSNNTFAATINLTEGNNTLHITATDKAGNNASASTGVILDTIPPTLTISSPSANAVLNTPSITITGHAADAPSGIASVAVNGINTGINGGVYTASNVQLEESPNTITVTATDNAGNTSSSSVTVTLDTTAPVINMTSPINGSTVNTGAIKVTGSIDDNSATVTVNGIAATVSNGTFTAMNISLTEGVNTITVTAKDAAGNSSTVSATVTRQSFGPESITIDIPQDGTTVNMHYVRISGTINDPTVSQITINGNNAWMSGNWFGGEACLAEGPNTLTIMATNSAGQSITRSLTVYAHDTQPPYIYISSPSAYSTVTSDTITVSADIYEFGNIAPIVTVNGVTADVVASVNRGRACNVAYTATVPGIKLAEGQNIITVTATDAVGNTSTGTVDVTYTIPDTTPPAISINSPINLSTVNTNTVTVTGAIDDDTATVTVNDVTAVVINNTFSASNIVLNGEKNIITVVAKDQAGNTTTSAITIYKDITAPVIAITTPTDNSTVNTKIITVTGAIDDNTATVTVNGVSAVVSNNVYTASNVMLYNEGANSVTVAATDPAGNSNSTSITVYRDTNPPVLTITSPINGSTVNTNTITVTGTTDDNSAVVKINGVYATVSNNTFSASNIPLVEGANVITVMATDARGNTGTTSVTVTYAGLDTTPPVITITSPSVYITSSTTITVSGTIDDNTATVKVNGLPATISNSTFTLSGFSLNEGPNNITFVATDPSGNSTTAYKYIFRDTIPPAITIASPLNGSSVPPVIMQVRLYDASYIYFSGFSPSGPYYALSIYVNNELAQALPLAALQPVPQPTPPYQMAYAYISENNSEIISRLKPGENSLTITARDAAGNSSSSTVKVYYMGGDTTAPVISITSPANNSTVTTNMITVKGTIDDLSASVKVNGVSAQVSTDPIFLKTTFTASGVPLNNEGANTITATATDTAGNAASTSITVYRDTMPVVSITSPANNTTVANGTITVTGTIDDNSAIVTVNGKTATVSNNVFTASGITLAEGVNTITASATDATGNTVNASVTITYVPDRTPPVVTITSPANNSTVYTNKITVTGTTDDGTATITVNGKAVAANNNTFSAGIGLTEGANVITVTATDPAGNTSSAQITINYINYASTPDPTVTATPINPTVATTTASATEFLYTGDNPVQTGVAPGTIEATRVAVLSGQVFTQDGTPLPGVKITVLDHPEYGSTQTRENGMLDMAVNGGGWITVNYEKNGYLPVQRKVDAPWQDYAWLPEVVMIPFDSKVTAIDLNSNIPVQVAQGSTISDADGTRTATLLFPQGTYATMQLQDGTWMSLSNINVRATEYTVGENGPKAMPGPLPPTSGYTYAVELSLDEAVIMGAKYVSFSKPVITYVENFLNFPVGGIVPVGWYDREKGVWVPSDNGKIIKILYISSGMAVLDVDGYGSAASSTTLAALGITDAERQSLTTLYQPGQSLWRVPITHFTPWDCNWPYGPPEDATDPKQPEPETDKKTGCSNSGVSGCQGSCADNQPGSIIECQNQTLGESINVVGTSSTLNYRSDRTPGRKAAYTINIPVSGATIPASLKRIELEIGIAGRKFTQTFSVIPNQTYMFSWDGKDAYGRTLNGAQPSIIRIGYVYQAVYQQPDNFVKSFGAVSGSPITGSRTRQEIIVWQERISSIGGYPGNWDARGAGLGGWTLNEHHTYDASGQVIYFGNGARKSAEGLAGIKADIQLSSPHGIAVNEYGDIYIVDSVSCRILKMNVHGIVTAIAGTGVCGDGGDGGPAINAQLWAPQGIALDSKGNIYVTDNANNRIRKIDTNGVITTVAGNGYYRFKGDGGLATSAELFDPYGVAVDPEGNIYVSDTGHHRIRKIGTDGVINTVVGSGTCYYYGYCSAGYSGDGGPAKQAKLNMPTGLTIDKVGNLYIADAGNYRIRKVSTSGIITTVAGNGTAGYSGDGGAAIDAQISFSYGLTIDKDGGLLFADVSNNRIRKISSDGIITTVAGTGTQGSVGKGGAAAAIMLNSPTGVAVDDSGNLYISGGGEIWKGEPTLPRFSGEDIVISSGDGQELYVFDKAGRHLRTINSTTGIVNYSFTYDSIGYVTSLTDRDGNVTTIERDSSGKPTAIVAPGGQRTELTLDANGYLASVANPNGETHQMTFTSDGLLTSFAKPKEGSTSILTYDSLGGLIKDEDAVGGFKTLSKTGNNSNYTSTVATAEGRVNGYQMERFSTGESRKTNTDPNGLTTITNTGTDGTTTTTAPDGTITTTIQGPDPRFGMQAPLTSSMTIKTPGGKIYSLSEGRTVSLSDTNNPLSIVTMTDTTTINGKTVTNIYNAAQRKFTTTTPVGRQRFTLLDANGRIAQEQTAGLNAVTYTYDTQGRLTGVTEGIRSTTIAYDSLNQLSSITDAAGRTVSFTYDLAGRVTEQTLPDSRVIAYSYDANGNVTSVTPPGRPAHNFTFDPRDLETYYNPPSPLLQGEGQGEGGVWSTQYAYNLDKQLTSIIRPDGQTIGLNYDNGGRLSTMTLPTGQLTYSYNSTTGNLSTVTAPSETLSYSYDGSLLTGTSWSGAITGSVGFSYNNDFRVTSASVNGANNVSYVYDNDGLLTGAGSLSISRDSQNGLITGSTLGSVTDSFSYSSFGEPSRYITNYSGSTLLDVQYTRDNLGRITSKTETVSGTTNTYAYTYDQAGRLTDVAKNSLNTAHYDYDANGNRVGWAAPTGSGSATYDNQDRLVTYGSTSYSYTANGELLSKTNSGQTTTYNYDVLGNLKAATLADGTAIEYLVDGQNRRIGKKVNGALVQGFLYENQLRPVAELDGSGNVVSRFVYGNKPNVPEFMIKGGVTYRIITDHLGSPRLVVNASTGAIAQQIAFDEYGNVTNDNNPGFMPFGFAGGLYDRDTKLVRFGARDYDPSVGRFGSKDPLRFKGGDANLFQYSVGNPISFLDPSGLEGYADTVTVVTSVGDIATAYSNPPTTPSGAVAFAVGTIADKINATVAFAPDSNAKSNIGLGLSAIGVSVAVIGDSLLSAFLSGYGLGTSIYYYPVYGTDQTIGDWWTNKIFNPTQCPGGR